MCSPSFNENTSHQCGVAECDNTQDTVLAANAGAVAYARYCLVNCCPSDDEYGSACMELTADMRDDAETRGGNGNDLKCQPLSERLGHLPAKPKEEVVKAKPKKQECKFGPCKPEETEEVLKARSQDLEQSVKAAFE